MQYIWYLCVKLVYTNMLVEQCALMHVFGKQPGCAIIGAWALIRTNKVPYIFSLFNIILIFIFII